jgi:hypothetical protein
MGTGSIPRLIWDTLSSTIYLQNCDK